MQKDTFKTVFMILILVFLGGGTIWTRYTMSMPQNNVGSFFSYSILLFAIIRYKISFKERYLTYFLFVLLIWSVLQSIKYRSIQIPFTFFYDVIYGYVILKVFNKDFLVYLEKGIYFLAKIGLVLWLLSWITYPFFCDLMYAVGSFFAIDKLESSIFVFGMFPLNIDDTSLIFVRNPGFAWEAGRFSALLNLGLLVCFYLKGSNHFNKRYWVYIITILTTQSTTGYMVMLIVLLSIIYNRDTRRLMRTLLVSMPIIIGIYSLPFVGDKMKTLLLEKDDKVELRLSNVSYYVKKDEEFVPQRIESLALELMNIQNDLYLGYGKDIKRSYISELFQGRIILYDGMLKVFSCFGLFWGVMYYYFLVYKSSCFFSSIYKCKGKLWYLILFLLINVSYYFIYEPLFLALGMFPYEVTYEKSRNITAI